MFQLFFIGEGAGKRRREIETASFQTLEKLQSALGTGFAFADYRCA